MMRLLLVLVLLGAPALARDNGQYEGASPDVRAWFRSQKSPKTGMLCCGEADGIYAEEDIREGQYWTRWGAHDWQPVPQDVVIHNPNRHGAPVVWWYVDKGETRIRCYAPGGGV
jgi:hypothetical protein